MSPHPRSTLQSVRRAKLSDSDTGTQIMKEPFRRRWRQLPLTGTPSYAVRRTDLFFYKKNQHIGRTTGGAF